MATSKIDTISDADLPALFGTSDQASLRAQRHFMVLVKADLFFLVMGAAFSSFNAADADCRRVLGAIGAFLLVSGFGVAFALRFTLFEQTWYGGRAIAESVKTLSWRYMTRARPFPEKLSEVQADKHLLESIAQVLNERKQLAINFDTGKGSQITQIMRDARAMTFQERLDLYLKSRIQSQRSWYASSSDKNARSEKWWFVGMLAAQGLAFAWSLYMIAKPEALNATGAIATLATAALTWIQVKKFRELAQVYGLTAQELSMVEAQAKHVSSEKELSEFVADAENAISREHTLWIARRDH